MRDIYIIAEVFYYVNYGSSIITSNNLSNENINIGVSRLMILIVHFGILIHICLETFF